MPPKKPRRTAERILETTLDLFNRFGEPNVSTTLISSELGISPGNLYYHYPAKDELINALLDRYEVAVSEVLQSSRGVTHIEAGWSFFMRQFDLMWRYRFLYRDLNDLLCRNRHFERRFGAMVAAKLDAVKALIDGMRGAGVLRMGELEAEPIATSMVVLATYWLSFEYVRDPRNALEPSRSEAALERGTAHVLSLLLPYLDDVQSAKLARLAGSYAMPSVLDSQPAALSAA
jgi:AcrR family transcriptional regulator